MARGLSNTDFTERVHELVGEEYVFNEEYKGRHTKIECTHTVCGYTWLVEAGVFLGNANKVGSRCPKCYGNKRITTEEYAKKIYSMYGDEYTLLSEYASAHKKVKIRHNICGNEYMVNPSSFTHGNGCAVCAGVIKYSDEYVKSIIENDDIGEYQLVSEYKGALSPISIKHLPCGSTFESTFGIILYRGYVPVCKKCETTHGEALVRKALDNCGIRYEREFFVSDKGANMYFDFYIPEGNIFIEYDGIQHFKRSFGDTNKQFYKRISRDRRKEAYIDERGFILIRIPYTVTSLSEVKETIQKFVKQRDSNQN